MTIGCQKLSKIVWRHLWTTPYLILSAVDHVEKEKLNYLKEYCDATSLHGWFFYGGSSSEKKTSISGFFWLAVLVGSMSAAVFVMGTTIQGNSMCYILVKKVFKFPLLFTGVLLLKNINNKIDVIGPNKLNRIAFYHYLVSSSVRYDM